ncbi:hypothetical protein T492DRAFT_996263 [Pavlovales sp. CCMP2436]|nr:hypothetical protein T492DRAFT_996263 [Pavlovales sp. CCMP2436]|mmetsp:Transcript_4345/g.11117  ORF Transcript_4345/g.11117 Transcript_4345/m.11117 type:complete len:177 (+) Transcript_4345:20-550(+)
MLASLAIACLALTSRPLVRNGGGASSDLRVDGTFGSSALSRRAAASIVILMPAAARAGILSGSSGITSGDSADAISAGVVGATSALGIKPRTATAEASQGDYLTRMLKQTEANRAKNDAAVYRRTLLNSEGARIFPGDGLTVFYDGKPGEVSMEEYKALMDEGRIVRGSRDVLPKQ